MTDRETAEQIARKVLGAVGVREERHYTQAADAIERAIADGKRELQAELAEKDDAHDKELGRWQDAIRAKVCSAIPSSDVWVDGSGCDSGDPLDLSLEEIGQVLNHFVDEIAEKETHVAQLIETIKVMQAEITRLKAEGELTATLTKLQETYGDIGWICIEDKLYCEEGCLPSRQSSIQINNKMYGGRSLALALAAALPSPPLVEGKDGQ